MKQTMPAVRIDNRGVKVPSGTTILEAAQRLGIEIPTLCHMESIDRFTSCMVCLVQESVTGRFLPSCSAPVTDGMVIETNTEAVREARRNILELLLREHVGDCESPCTRACPLYLDIPVMLGKIARDMSGRVRSTQLTPIPLFRTIEYICPAPCERACRRGSYDEPVSIRLALQAAAEYRITGDTSEALTVSHSSGKKVAVVGAGPAGLSAAYHLRLLGHDCTIFDDQDEPGGSLRTQIPKERLPRPVLDHEINRIRELGVIFLMNRSLGKDVDLRDLRRRFDAIVITTGIATPVIAGSPGIRRTEQGIQINRETFETSLEGIFAGGSAVRPCRIAARSVANGRSVAFGVHRYLGECEADVPGKRFDLHMGTLRDGEMDAFLQGASRSPRIHPSGENEYGFTREEAARESARCLHCDCGKKDACLLRTYAHEYGATGHRYRVQERTRYERILEHPHILYEPSKCIKCGRCVRLTEQRNEHYGLYFKGRSYSVCVAVPFGETLARGLEKSALECTEACPTGALVAR